MNAEELVELASGLTEDQMAELCESLPPDLVNVLLHDLDQVDRQDRNLDPLLPHQLPPAGDWDGWLLTGGRGVGKTYAGARWIGDLAASTSGLRGRIIAPTLGDAVQSVVLDPQSGILAAYPEAQLKRTGVEGVRVIWPNGSTVWCIGTPTPSSVDRLRALTNIDADLYEEAAANPQLAAAVEQARLSRRGNRLPRPLWIATTTPRPVPTIREWVAGGGFGETVVATRATTMDNPHTPDQYRTLAQRLKGTRAYRQEILGEVLDDVEGALWKQSDLETSAIHPDDRDELMGRLVRVVVGVDPPSGSGTCGIVVVGADQLGHVYVLDDYSVTNPSPAQWAKAALQASRDYDNALVVAEKNQGGRMVTSVLQEAQDRSGPQVPITTVTASVGKQARAEPVAVLWEADDKLGHMAPTTLGALAELEDQLVTWVPGTFSPDRLDAMVWAVTKLRQTAGHRSRLSNPARSSRQVPARATSSSAYQRRSTSRI